MSLKSESKISFSNFFPQASSLNPHNYPRKKGCGGELFRITELLIYITGQRIIAGYAKWRCKQKDCPYCQSPPVKGAALLRRRGFRAQRDLIQKGCAVMAEILQGGLVRLRYDGLNRKEQARIFHALNRSRRGRTVAWVETEKGLELMVDPESVNFVRQRLGRPTAKPQPVTAQTPVEIFAAGVKRMGGLLGGKWGAEAEKRGTCVLPVSIRGESYIETGDTPVPPKYASLTLFADDPYSIPPGTLKQFARMGLIHLSEWERQQAQARMAHTRITAIPAKPARSVVIATPLQGAVRTMKPISPCPIPNWWLEDLHRKQVKYGLVAGAGGR